MATLTIEVPEDVAVFLQSEAAQTGRTAEQKMAEEAIARYMLARQEAPSILNGSFSAIEAASVRRRERFGFPDLANSSEEEIARRADDAIYRLTSEQLDAARKAGVL